MNDLGNNRTAGEREDVQGSMHLLCRVVGDVPECCDLGLLGFR